MRRSLAALAVIVALVAAACSHGNAKADYVKAAAKVCDASAHDIEVVDFPAFIVVDDKGNDFFADLTGGGDALKVLK